MTPTVTLKISNPNNKVYPTIILRKFFNMVFVEPDGKTLNIYTATVFGGAEATTDKSSIPTPKFAQNNDCALKFTYDISGVTPANGRKNEVSVKFQNITDSFLSTNGKKPNRDQVKQVWGNITELNQQNTIGHDLKTLYPTIYADPNALPTPDVSSRNYFRFDNDKRGPSHSFIATYGDFSDNTGNKSYTLKNPVKIAGVEAINWVKTTIVLNCDILKPAIVADRKIQFNVQFENDAKNGKNCCTRYYTPDFTWYFAPPPNYVVDDSALVDVADKLDIDNIVTPVADKDTVQLDKWIEERILERKKSRVLMKNYIAEDPYILSAQKVGVNLSFSNPGKHGNTQFFIGLVLAFFLSYCADKTRLNDFLTICEGTICQCPKPCQCNLFCNSLGIWLPFLVIISFFALMFTKKRCLPEPTSAEIALCILKALGLLTAFVLMTYIYYVWLVHPDLLATIITTCAQNQLVIKHLLWMSLIFNGLYVGYCIFVKKKNIIDYL